MVEDEVAEVTECFLASKKLFGVGHRRGSLTGCDNSETNAPPERCEGARAIVVAELMSAFARSLSKAAGPLSAMVGTSRPSAAARERRTTPRSAAESGPGIPQVISEANE
jgi:hypothetical protein